MSSIAEVILWGRRIGVVAAVDDSGVYSFQYDPEFVAGAAGVIEPAPIEMPLRDRPYSFRALSRETFHGLPGMLSDSLPDRYGTALIDAWLQSQGREPRDLSPLERLCYIGTRGMGALEYQPAQSQFETTSTPPLSVNELQEIASLALRDRETLIARLHEDDQGAQKAMSEILRVGTSAGGARAKALIAWHEGTGEIRSGQLDELEGFSYWILKFDGIGDPGREDSLGASDGYGAIEYAYSLMAKHLGIEMSRCRLHEEGGRRHFMIERFDRTASGGKVHMQTLGALAHLDFNLAGANAYEQAFEIARRIGVDETGIEQLYRRMVFNVVAANCDDHVKNISFLMDKRGSWELAPAYDLTFAYNPEGQWTSSHQMTINSKRTGFTLEDFTVAAKRARLRRGAAKRIFSETVEVVSRWPEFADRAGVPEAKAERIASAHQFSLPER